jgi:hypothetical protein
MQAFAYADNSDEAVHTSQVIKLSFSINLCVFKFKFCYKAKPPIMIIYNS